ncbi:hypothetical protein LAWI1_G007857 [Lachnellula willkommii]|uniref:Uncharacterized protein n=1 Tax=Lachnellula willkommii TaxID=215461 RepID=A0A559M8X4_9HELO|nr:hypothetical protein LAWI1_G007857 [Lachnellula willkommii]
MSAAVQGYLTINLNIYVPLLYFSSIRAVCLYFGVNIKLEILAAKKRSLFPTLVDLCKSLKNCSLSAALSI